MTEIITIMFNKLIHNYYCPKMMIKKNTVITLKEYKFFMTFKIFSNSKVIPSNYLLSFYGHVFSKSD